MLGKIIIMNNIVNYGYDIMVGFSINNREYEFKDSIGQMDLVKAEECAMMLMFDKIVLNVSENLLKAFNNETRMFNDQGEIK